MEKDLLYKLYIKEEQSMQQIATDLGVSTGKVTWWMNKYGIERRTKSAESYKWHNPDGDPFDIQEPKTNDEYFMLGLGLGLFWGEGNKVSKYSVRLGNTDPDLILYFVKFLKESCRVNPDKIKFGLQVFNDTNQDEAFRYWQQKLNCGPESFHPTIVVIPQQGKGNYTKKSLYGVIQIYVNNKKLKDWISGKIIELRYNI